MLLCWWLLANFQISSALSYFYKTEKCLLLTIVDNKMKINSIHHGSKKCSDRIFNILHDPGHLISFRIYDWKGAANQHKLVVYGFVEGIGAQDDAQRYVFPWRLMPLSSFIFSLCLCVYVSLIYLMLKILWFGYFSKVLFCLQHAKKWGWYKYYVWYSQPYHYMNVTYRTCLS